MNCPICLQEVKITDSPKGEVKCNNEYYTHYVGDLLYKKKNPKIPKFI